MKKLSILIGLLIAFLEVQAQKRQLPSFNSIRTPNSPAFTILGVQPTSIERPNTPADLAISMDNSTEGFTKFPENYSIEVAPFWMGKQAQSLTWKKDTVRSIEESLARTFSVSFATTNKEVGEKEVRGLSYGLRTFILSGKMSKKSVKELTDLEKELYQIAKRNTDKELQIQLLQKLAAATNQQEKDDAKDWFDREKKKRDEERDDEGSEEAQEIAPQREGLIVEIAYAGAYGNDTTETDLQKRGYAFWLTPSYVKDQFSLVGVYRYMKDSLDLKSEEYGFRFIYTEARYAASVEYLKGNYKSDTPIPDRERLSILIEYMLDKNLWLNLSFGEDNKNINGKNSLFSTLGLKYNFSSKRYKF